MSDQRLQDFEQKYKELEGAVKVSEDYADLRKRCNELFTQLREISPRLASYDRERFYLKVESLLKQISLKESPADGTTRRFRFQKKISLKKSKPSTAAETIIQSSRHDPAVRTGEIITIQSSTSSYENLDQCTLMCNPNADYNESGSIILRNVCNGLVNLQPVPFSTGSVFITDCHNVTVLCSTPPHNAVQIRLHNLKNCKLFIIPQDTTSKQVVVLENCVNCVFQKSTEHLIKLQDFSALNLRNSIDDEGSYDAKAYRFELFD